MSKVFLVGDEAFDSKNQNAIRNGQIAPKLVAS
jgi:hypothetical protein